MADCVLIANPVAGRIRPEAAPERLAAALRRAGLVPDLRCTRHRGDAESYARDAAGRGCDLVVAAGGDGTVNEVVNGLLGSETRLCIVPCGTANVLALELGLPLEPEAACALAGGGRARALDAGVANGRAFVMSAGMGFDGAVVRGVTPALKRRLGKGAYWLAAVRQIVYARPALYNLRVDGEARRASLWGILACNTVRYAGRWQLMPHAAPDDGLLDLCLLYDNGRAALVRTLLDFIRDRASSSPHIGSLSARRVEIAASPHVPVQLDGDDFTDTPLIIEVRPGALRIMSPLA